MVKEIGPSFKYHQSKISTPALKKPVLSYSKNLTSYTTNLTRTIISSQIENEDSTTIQNTSEILNTDYIHSCVTPRKLNIIVPATPTPPHLISFITTLPLAPIELPKKQNYPQLVKNICISRLTSNILMILNVLNQGY